MADNAILDYSVAQLDEEFMDPVEPPLGEELPPGMMPFRTRQELPPPPIFSQRFLPPMYG
jgi:general transcription factor 3C polypeptide 5 (transcription factor C subunit 1)